MHEQHICTRNWIRRDPPEFAETLESVSHVIQAGLIDGYLQAIVRPDGQIGYAPTDKALVALREDGE